MCNAITFPFERGKLYSIEALDKFLQTIVNARKLDPNISAAERARTVPWAKLWWEELYPVKLFVDHNEQLSCSHFLIMPEGDAVDVQLYLAGNIIRFQITTAYPEWSEIADDRRTGGYTRHLEREGLNQGVPVFTGGQIKRDANCRVISQPEARSPEIDQAAWQLGLSNAIGDKLAKFGTADVLLVYAERLRFDTIDDDTSSVVLPVIAACCTKYATIPFTKIVVIDQDHLAYVEYP